MANESSPDTRVRFKTDITGDTKTKADLKGRAYTAGQEATLPKQEAKKLVDGGFADYLDQSGNVISEKNTRADDAAAPAPDASGDAKAAKQPKAVPEGERAKPAEAGAPEPAEAPSRARRLDGMRGDRPAQPDKKGARK